MLHSPLYELQKQLGAKFTEFAGFEMPLYYSSIIGEHLAVRRKVGVFDVSHMGNVLIEGDDAEQLLSLTSVADVSKLSVRRSVYTVFLKENGTIIDDLIIYSLGDNCYVFIPNAGQNKIVVPWLQEQSRQRKLRVKIKDVTLDWLILAIQGPLALKSMQKITDYNLEELKPFDCSTLKITGIPIICSRTGYTGEDGFELQFSATRDGKVFRSVLEVGKEFGILPCGLGARDSLRLEKGFALAPNEFAGGRTPLEAGLSWTINWDHEFIGKSFLQEQNEAREYERLVYLRCKERCVPRHGCEVVEGRRVIGKVSSGGLSPCLKKGIAMAYVKPAYRELGKRLDIFIHQKPHEAEVIKPPFVKRGEC
jgi:aminomethyltransferase